MTPEIFDRLCIAHDLPIPEHEYQFAPPRKWRFDYAWVVNYEGIPQKIERVKLALEIQGGLFTGGRHSRGPALLKEHEKLNTAVILGWRVLFCVPKDLETGKAFEWVKKALLGKQP